MWLDYLCGFPTIREWYGMQTGKEQPPVGSKWRPNFAEYCYLWDRRFCWMYQNNIYNYLCAEYTAEGYTKEVTDKRVVFREE